EEIAVDVLPGVDLDARFRARDIFSRGALAGQLQAGTAALVFQQREPFRGEHQHRIRPVSLAQQSVADELIDVTPYLTGRSLGEQSERGQSFVASRDDLLARLAAQHAG